MGHGSHLSPTVAAIRAITEAAQSRLTFIQGSREDLWEESYQFGETHTRVYSFFERQRGDLSWDNIADHASGDLLQDLETVVSGLASAGYTRVYRIELTSARFGIPVVKVTGPRSSQCNTPSSLTENTKMTQDHLSSVGFDVHMSDLDRRQPLGVANPDSSGYVHVAANFCP